MEINIAKGANLFSWIIFLEIHGEMGSNKKNFFLGKIQQMIFKEMKGELYKVEK